MGTLRLRPKDLRIPAGGVSEDACDLWTMLLHRWADTGLLVHDSRSMAWTGWEKPRLCAAMVELARGGWGTWLKNRAGADDDLVELPDHAP